MFYSLNKLHNEARRGTVYSMLFTKGFTPWNKGKKTGLIPKNKGQGRATVKEFWSGGIKIPLSQDKFAIVDEEDFERVNKYKWHLTTSDNKNFYAKKTFWVNGRGKDIKLHRFILRFKIGQSFPAIDHINFNGLDNRKINLRIATSTQNSQHSRRLSKHGYKGIYQNHNKWAARIKVNKKQIRKFQFDTPKQAAEWYNKMAIKYFGEFAKLNSI